MKTTDNLYENSDSILSFVTKITYT